MAGEITQEAIVLALGGAGIGATGAIVAQIVGGIFTTGREKRKANSDRELWELEAEAKRRDRSIEQKTELMTEILTLAENLISDVYFRSHFDSGVTANQNAQYDELRRSVHRLSILVPEVYPHAKALLNPTGRFMLTRHTDFYNNVEHSEDVGNRINAEYAIAGSSVRSAQDAFSAYISHKSLPEVFTIGNGY
ncbi:hypothetical protein [Paeniglutamicibacter sp. NPDC091659]|uniref:hypothetical protein n=1 Tax=Paeniglutamicibacter sp. NPDC091659 TaxID=3364389 RepID=UPI003830975E